MRSVIRGVCYALGVILLAGAVLLIPDALMVRDPSRVGSVGGMAATLFGIGYWFGRPNP